MGDAEREARIREALDEPCPECGWQQSITFALTTQCRDLAAERDEFRAEVGRLRADLRAALDVEDEGYDVIEARLMAQRDHARFMAAGWRRLLASHLDHLEALHLGDLDG